MPVTTFPCPACRVVLKPTQPVPPGKKIKCPKCGHIFVTTASGPSTNPGSQPKPRIPVAALVDEPEEDGWELVEEEEPAPAGKKSAKAKKIAERDDEEDEDNGEVAERPGPRRKAAQKMRRRVDDEEDEDDDWDEDDEDEDYPRRRSGRKSAASKLLKIYLGIIALVVLLLAGGTAGGLYWYLNRERNRGTGNEDPLAFVLPDSTVVSGLDLAALATESTIRIKVEEAVRRDAPIDFFKNVKNETGLEIADLFERAVQAESPAASGAGWGAHYTTTVFRSRTPFSQRKIRNCLPEPTAEKIKGKTIYRIANESKTVFMPSDRIMVVTNLPDNQLETIVGSDGTSPALGSEAQNLLRSVEKHHIWFVVPISGTMRSQIERSKEAAPPNFLPLLKLLNKAQGAAGGVTFSGGQATIEAELAFSDSVSAKELTSEIEGFWNREIKGLTTQIALSALPIKSLTDLLKEVIKTTKFSSEGSKTKATAQFSVQNLTNFLSESAKQESKQFQGGLFAPAPGPGGRTAPAPGPAVPRGPVQPKKKR